MILIGIIYSVYRESRINIKTTTKAFIGGGSNIEKTMDYIMLSTLVVAYFTVAAVLWFIQEEYKKKANKLDK